MAYINTISLWKRSIDWKALLLLMVITLPVLLLEWGGCPLIVDSHVEDGTQFVQVHQELLWRSVEVRTVQSFRPSGDATSIQTTAFEYSAAIRMHSVARVIAITLCLIPLYVYRNRLPSIRQLRLPTRRSGILAVCTTIVIIQVIASFLASSGWKDPMSDSLVVRRFLWEYLLSTLLISPFFEEFYYRRFLQTSLDVLRVPWYLSVVLTGFAFGFSHVGPTLSAISLTVFGIFSGVAYQVTGRLWVSVGLHFGLNVWSLLGRIN